MRWPWVSRASYDALDQRLLRALAQTDDALKMAERSADLTLRMIDRLAAATPPPVERLPMVQLPPPLRDEISEAIDLAAGPDKALARHLARWAKQQQLDGGKEHDIIQSILHWHSATEWDGTADDAPSRF